MFQVTIFIGYAAAALLLLSVARAHDQARKSRYFLALGVGLLTLATHLVQLLQDLILVGAARISLGTTASFIGAVVAITALAGSRKASLRGLAALLLPIAGLLALTSIAGSPDPATSVDHERWYLYAHVVLSVLAYGLFGVAAALAVAMALQDRRIRAGQAGGISRILPPLETMETTLFGAIGVGVAALSLAIFSGLIFVDDMFAQHLAHKTILTLLAWIVFSTLLLGRWRFGWRGRKAIKWTLWGFASLMLAYFGSRLILEVLLGRHWG